MPRRKKWDLALLSFDNAIREKTELRDAYYNKGYTYELMQKYQEALSCYNSVIALDENDAQSHYSKASVLNETGRYNEALASLEKLPRSCLTGLMRGITKESSMPKKR